mmetsp:Transcript_950/g.1049  ORF Transcript_950/g.1049 Transcript_950/m.1049 type:complete len:437 (+) Transcript_950:177-1487(+)
MFDDENMDDDDDDDDAGSSSTTTTTATVSDFNEQTWLLFWATIIIVLSLFYCVRHYCYIRIGLDICHPCSSFQERKRRSENGGGEMSEQEAADHLLAQELQRQLAREQFEQDRLATRKERRVWYEYYLKPYSMVVKEGDLFYAQDKETMKATENNLDQEEGEEIEDNDDDDDDGPVIRVCQQPTTTAIGPTTATSKENNDEESGIQKHKTAASSSSQSQLIPCTEHDDDAVLYLQLPAVDPTSSTPLRRVGSSSHLEKSYVHLQQQQEHERQQRHYCNHHQRRDRSTIDATCALCIGDYEVGDTIVWSHDTTKCSHVYHKDCLLEWLTKGKKHCPVCRSWFVPGSSIQNQKIAHGLPWRCALIEHQQLELEMEREREEKEREEEEENKKLQLTTTTSTTKNNDDESQSSDDDDNDDDDNERRLYKRNGVGDGDKER